MEEKDALKFDKDKIMSVNTGNEVNTTQAEKESELLPVYEGMSFSGDIQPLDDIIEEEEIKVDFDNLNKENKELIKQQNSSNRNSGKTANKKIILDIGGFIYSIRKKLITAVIIVAVLVGAGFGGYHIVQKMNTSKATATTVFVNSNNESIVRMSDEEKFSIGKDVQSVKISSDGKNLYYIKSTFSKTGRYDLYAVDMTSTKSVKKHGTLVDNGIEDDWTMTTNGSFVTYSKIDSGAKTYYMYSAEAKRKAVIADAVERLYAPSNGDVVYFTRKSGNATSLHRARFSEKSESVVSDIDKIKFFESDDGFELMYTIVNNSTHSFDLYRVTGLEPPVQISSGINEVEMGSYEYGGNLYFYKRNFANINWRDFIVDNYYDKDLDLKEPVESDFMEEKGFIFKRYKLNQNAYNSALKDYNAKLLRDSIRAGLDDLDLGLETREEYTCFAYINGNIVTLSSGVALDDVISCASTGAPRMIYRSSKIEVDEKINMDKLVELTANGDSTKALELVRSTVSDSYKVTDTCMYSWYNGSKTATYQLEDYSSGDTDFAFGGNNVLYAVENGNLNIHRINDSGVSEKYRVDTYVSEMNVQGNSLYYIKSVSGVDSLCRCTSDGKTAKICDKEYSFKCMSEDFVVVLTTGESTEVVDIGIFNGWEYKVIDKNVKYNSFVNNDNSFAYIKDYQNDGGSMYIYTANNGSVKCADKVSKILVTVE